MYRLKYILCIGKTPHQRFDNASRASHSDVTVMFVEGTYRMPRAENRKRPPNSLGNVPGSRRRNQFEGTQNGPEHLGAKDKKQELLEKMRKIQRDKKVDTEQK